MLIVEKGKSVPTSKKTQHQGRYFANILFRDPAGGEGSKVTDLDNVTSILGLPGYEVLSHNERRLCTSLRLHPSLYISYKTCLLQQQISKKKNQSTKAVHPSGLDKLHRRKAGD